MHKVLIKGTPRRGIEPRSPAWQAGILTTILSWSYYQMHIFELINPSICWINVMKVDQNDVLFNILLNRSINRTVCFLLFSLRVTELRHGWTSAQELRHRFRKISLTSAQVILLHHAEVKISMELGAEINITCRSPQVGAEVIPCRSYSVAAGCLYDRKRIGFITCNKVFSRWTSA